MTTIAYPNGRMHVRFSPLAQQFAEPDDIFAELRELVTSGDFTLGKPVQEFEQMFADTLGVKYAIGVGSGTDALKVGLKAVGIGLGDEVITAANTFWATVGAINELGARPVFVDCDDTFCLDIDKIEQAIGPNTRAIMPVHLTGDVMDMPRLMEVADRHGLKVVEDACQSLMGEWDGKRAGTFGVAAGFSIHPLKIINVWGDGGLVVTDDPEIDRLCRLLRNHGLKNRDEMEIFGFNTRLDSVQAVVGKWILRQIEDIVAKRAENAAYYDAALADVPQVRIPTRNPRTTHVYLLYMIFADDRDELMRYCLDAGIEAKLHYPIPLYRQKALRSLGYKNGDFPVTDRHAQEVISFPVDQHLSRAEQDYVIDVVKAFYADRTS